MEDFTLDIIFNGKSLSVLGRLATFSYTHKIYLEVEGVCVTLEPDEERNYRALVSPADLGKLDPELLKLLTQQIESLAK